MSDGLSAIDEQHVINGQKSCAVQGIRGQCQHGSILMGDDEKNSRKRQ